MSHTTALDYYCNQFNKIKWGLCFFVAAAPKKFYTVLQNTLKPFKNIVSIWFIFGI